MPVLPEPVDAIAPNPKTGELVWLNGRKYDRKPLETAWLHLGAADGHLLTARQTMRDAGWDTVVCVEYTRAALGWTGNVVAGEVR